jgi:predicted amidohydrolase YtcJ
MAGATLAVATGCRGPVPEQTADTIYTGGNIITVYDAAPSAAALAVKDGKILAVGAKADVLKTKGDTTKLVDLGGKTLIPGFVDAHGHLSQVGIQAISANLLPPPDGAATSIPQIQKAMRDFIATSPTVKQYGLAIGFDYDDSQLAERRHLTRQELDEISTEIPILVIHQSGHLGVYSSKALANAHITADSPNPEGGTIYREADGKTPNGLMDENAHIAMLMKTLPKFTPEQMIEMIGAAQDIYAKYGFTTVQDGRTDPASLAVFPQAAKTGALKLDVVAYPDLVMNEKSPLLQGAFMSRGYTAGQDSVVHAALFQSPGRREAGLQRFPNLPAGCRAGRADDPGLSQQLAGDGSCQWRCGD